MPVAMLIDTPDGSRELYEALVAELELDEPVGGVVHVAGPGPLGGWRILEVWETVEEASRFLEERLLPALQILGSDGRPPRPQSWPVHRCLTAPGAPPSPTLTFGGVLDAS